MKGDVIGRCLISRPIDAQFSEYRPLGVEPAQRRFERRARAGLEPLHPGLRHCHGLNNGKPPGLFNSSTADFTSPAKATSGWVIPALVDSDYRPLKFGLRFSMNARRPSI